MDLTIASPPLRLRTPTARAATWTAPRAVDPTLATVEQSSGQGLPRTNALYPSEYDRTGQVWLD